MIDDVEALRELNEAYLESVRMGDADRFREILADDFLCSAADGSVLDKSEFLELTAGPRTLRHLSADDVRIRLLGDVAIIHAATYYTTMAGCEAATEALKHQDDPNVLSLQELHAALT